MPQSESFSAAPYIKEGVQKAGSDYYKLPTAVEASASFRVTAAAGETSVDAAVGTALMMPFLWWTRCFYFSYLPPASNLDPGASLSIWMWLSHGVVQSHPKSFLDFLNISSGLFPRCTPEINPGCHLLENCFIEYWIRSYAAIPGPKWISICVCKQRVLL